MTLPAAAFARATAAKRPNIGVRPFLLMMLIFCFGLLTLGGSSASADYRYWEGSVSLKVKETDTLNENHPGASFTRIFLLNTQIDSTSPILGWLGEDDESDECRDVPSGDVTSCGWLLSGPVTGSLTQYRSPDYTPSSCIGISSLESSFALGSIGDGSQMLIRGSKNPEEGRPYQIALVGVRYRPADFVCDEPPGWTPDWTSESVITPFPPCVQCDLSLKLPPSGERGPTVLADGGRRWTGGNFYEFTIPHPFWGDFVTKRVIATWEYDLSYRPTCSLTAERLQEPGSALTVTVNGSRSGCAAGLMQGWDIKVGKTTYGFSGLWDPSGTRVDWMDRLRKDVEAGASWAIKLPLRKIGLKRKGKRLVNAFRTISRGLRRGEKVRAMVTFDLNGSTESIPIKIR